MENYTPILPTSPEQQVLSPEMPEDLFIFAKAKIHIDQLISAWSVECKDCELRRKERYVDIDVETLRNSGELGEDETMVAVRTIDNNISREKADVMAFLNAGYRLGVFRCLSDPTIETRNLELEVTEGLTYEGWYSEFDKTVDGSELHGFDYLEVVFDVSKPLHVGFEHRGYDRVYYNKNVSDIQSSDRVVIRYDVTMFNLEQFVKRNGFNDIEVQKILTSHKEAKRQDSVKIYKVYFKVVKDTQDCVYVAWYCNENNVSDWIKAPDTLKLGIYPDGAVVGPDGTAEQSEVDLYPVFKYLYKDDEQEAIVDHKGRGFLDSPIQEAATAQVSAYTNGVVKASAIYCSPETDDGESGEMKQLDIKLIPDGIYNKPLRFFSKPYPEVTLLQGIQLLNTISAEQTGKPAYAVKNRQDSRKTAKELEVATEEQTKITSTGLATFSEFLRGVLNFSWKIIRSQALQGKIPLLLVQIPDPATGQPSWKNDIRVIGQIYDIRPAGDTDIVEAAQEVQKMMADWPVIQTTPLAPQFLVDFIKLRYPKKATEYIQILNQGDMGKKLVAGMGSILQSAEVQGVLAQEGPQQQAELQQLEQQAAAYLQPTK
jgi:hypothetical protein